MQCDTCFWFKDERSCACFDFKGKTAAAEIKGVQEGMLKCPFYIEGEYDHHVVHNGLSYEVNFARPKGGTKPVLELTTHNPYSTRQFDTTEKLKRWMEEQKWI